MWNIVGASLSKQIIDWASYCDQNLQHVMHEFHTYKHAAGADHIVVAIVRKVGGSKSLLTSDRRVFEALCANFR